MTRAETLNDLVKSAQLVTSRCVRQKQTRRELSTVPVNKHPLRPAMPGTVSAVSFKVSDWLFPVLNCMW